MFQENLKIYTKIKLSVVISTMFSTSMYYLQTFPLLLFSFILVSFRIMVKCISLHSPLQYLSHFMFLLHFHFLECVFIASFSTFLSNVKIYSFVLHTNTFKYLEKTKNSPWCTHILLHFFHHWYI